MNNKPGQKSREPVAAVEESASGVVSPPQILFAKAPYLRPLLKPAFWVIVLSLLAGLYVQTAVDPQWREHKSTYQTYLTADKQLAYRYKGQETHIHETVAYSESPLRQSSLDQVRGKPALKQQWVYSDVEVDGEIQRSYSSLSANFHFGPWSLLPAFVAVALCLLTKEPLSALLGGIVAGGFMLGKFDITDDILLPSLATESAAGVLMLYLWLLGGLMGIWSRTGAAQAFAEFMTVHFVRGPRSAKMVAWSLGVIFFQGGSVSTVLVGTTVRPLADKNNISHEELAYIVDSTASPIASVLAFNAWPAYIQALIFVPGVAFLSTEAERLSFFFSSIPFSFYGILAVLGTLLLSLDFMKFSGAGLRKARKRARETGNSMRQVRRP